MGAGYQGPVGLDCRVIFKLLLAVNLYPSLYRQVKMEIKASQMTRTGSVWEDRTGLTRPAWQQRKVRVTADSCTTQPTVVPNSTKSDSSVGSQRFYQQDQD